MPRHGWRRIPTAACGLAVGLVLTVQLHGRDQADALDPILAKAASYVTTFVDRFSNVVAEERFEQKVTLAPFARGVVGIANGQTRVLRSDLLIVSETGPLNWVAFRDVFEVDGAPVRDRDNRLQRLLAQPDPNSQRQASRIATESARFNLGPGPRTTNTPELAVLFLQTSLQGRFTFTLRGRETVLGDEVRIVEYREQARPTLVQDQNDRNLASSGRFWIEPATGRVRRSELVLRQVNSTYTLTTTFAYDARFEVCVPVEMLEVYEAGNMTLKGTATYSRFRSFAVTTDQQVHEPVP